MATSLVSYIDRNAKTTPAICRYGCLKINIPKEISAFKQRFFKKGPLEESFTFFCSPTFCVISIEARLFGWRISFSPKLVGCKEYREEYKTARGFFSSWITELLEEFFSKTRHPPRTRQPCLSDQTLKNEKCIQIPGNLAIFREHGLTSGYKTISIVERKEKTLRP